MERTNRVKFIPPCLLRKFASLTCSESREIIIFDRFSILGNGREIIGWMIKKKNIFKNNL